MSVQRSGNNPKTGLLVRIHLLDILLFAQYKNGDIKVYY